MEGWVGLGFKIHLGLSYYGGLELCSLYRVFVKQVLKPVLISEHSLSQHTHTQKKWQTAHRPVERPTGANSTAVMESSSSSGTENAFQSAAWSPLSVRTSPEPLHTTACIVNNIQQVTVTVTEALVLRPLLEDRGRITESIHILVPVNRMKQKCFQIMTKRVRRSQQFHLPRQPVPCSPCSNRKSSVDT